MRKKLLHTYFELIVLQRRKAQCRKIVEMKQRQLQNGFDPIVHALSTYVSKLNQLNENYDNSNDEALAYNQTAITKKEEELGFFILGGANCTIVRIHLVT